MPLLLANFRRDASPVIASACSRDTLSRSSDNADKTAHTNSMVTFWNNPESHLFAACAVYITQEALLNLHPQRHSANRGYCSTMSYQDHYPGFDPERDIMDQNSLAPTAATPTTEVFYDTYADLPLLQENAGDMGKIGRAHV